MKPHDARVSLLSIHACKMFHRLAREFSTQHQELRLHQVAHMRQRGGIMPPAGMQWHMWGASRLSGPEGLPPGGNSQTKAAASLWAVQGAKQRHTPAIGSVQDPACSWTKLTV